MVFDSCWIRCGVVGTPKTDMNQVVFWGSGDFVGLGNYGSALVARKCAVLWGTPCLAPEFSAGCGASAGTTTPQHQSTFGTGGADVHLFALYFGADLFGRDCRQ